MIHNIATINSMFRVMDGEICYKTDGVQVCCVNSIKPAVHGMPCYFRHSGVKWGKS